jgi:hypothetical protein
VATLTGGVRLLRRSPPAHPNPRDKTRRLVHLRQCGRFSKLRASPSRRAPADGLSFNLHDFAAEKIRDVFDVSTSAKFTAIRRPGLRVLAGYWLPELGAPLNLRARPTRVLASASTRPLARFPPSLVRPGRVLSADEAMKLLSVLEPNPTHRPAAKTKRRWSMFATYRTATRARQFGESPNQRARG